MTVVFFFAGVAAAVVLGVCVGIGVGRETQRQLHGRIAALEADTDRNYFQGFADGGFHQRLAEPSPN